MKTLSTALVAFFGCLLIPGAVFPSEDIPIADFEGPDYGDWKATGEAFGSGPARGTLPNQMEVSGFIEGEYVRGRLSLDAATNLIYKYEYEIERELPKGKGIVKGEERYLRYAEKEGFKYPAEVVSKQAQKTSRLKLLSVSFNSMLSDDLFQNPVPPVPEKK